MSLERWHGQVKEKSGQQESNTFWISEPEPLEGFPTVKLRYISARGGNNQGLPEGIYVQTNLTVDGYGASRDLRSMINSQICLALVDGKKVLSIGRGPELDLSNAMRATLAFTTVGDAVVLKIEPVLPSEVDAAVKDAVTGRSNASIVFPKRKSGN